VKHIKHELNKGGVSDQVVYNLATKLRRIIVTYNIGDFRKLATKSKNAGVIGATLGLTPEQLDKTLNALLSRNTGKSLYGKYTSLGSKEKR